MRIAFVHQSAELYGSDKVLLTLVRDLSTRGVEPVVLLPNRGPLSAALEASDIRVAVTPVLKVARADMGPAGAWRLAREAVRVTRAIDAVLAAGPPVDLVHTNTLAVLAGAVWARRRGVPHLWHVHEIIERPRVAARGFPLLAQWLSDRVICVSGAARDWLVGGQRGLEDRARVIWNGIEMPADRPRPGAAAPTGGWMHPDRPVIGLVGRINHWKGQGLLLEAVERLAARGLRDFTVLIAGGVAPGQEHMRSELTARIARSPLADRIVLQDYTEDVWSLWREIDICCVPSTLPEPFGLVAVEAMAMGRPVVAAGHGGLAEIVVPGRTGLLFRPNDAASLADALSTLLTDAPLRECLGQAGRQRAHEHFSARAMSDSFIDCYREILRR